MTFAPGRTGLQVIDPYNDFVSEGGKVWDRLPNYAAVVKTNEAVDAMRAHR
jgi:ureidoacrylate peracid hydrolase